MVNEYHVRSCSPQDWKQGIRISQCQGHDLFSEQIQTAAAHPSAELRGIQGPSQNQHRFTDPNTYAGYLCPLPTRRVQEYFGSIDYSPKYTQSLTLQDRIEPRGIDRRQPGPLTRTTKARYDPSQEGLHRSQEESGTMPKATARPMADAIGSSILGYNSFLSSKL
jgi:hypothetical protein